MKHIYLVNRFYLKERGDDLIRKLEKASDALCRDYEIVQLHSPEEAGEIRNRYQETEHIITTIGGDGSVNLLLNNLVGTKNVLSFLPSGTGNDFYRMCEESMENGLREVDIIRINDRFFINTACFGIDADIANDERFIHNRLIPKPMRFNAGVLYHFLTWNRGRKLRVECNDEVIEKEFTTVVACNGRYYGGGYRISPESDPCDGKMEIYLVNSLPKIKMAKTILSIKEAGHLQNPALRKITATKMTVETEHDAGVNIDGEAMAGSRFELEVLPRGARLYYDRELIGRMKRNE